MSLRSRFALAFAAIGALVAVAVGVLGYRAASDRVLAEIDRSLRSSTVAFAQARDQAQAVSDAVTRGPDLYPGPDRPGPGDEGDRQTLVQTVAPDGTTARLAGPAVSLPVTDTARALATDGAPGASDLAEIDVAGHTYRRLVTALGGDRGALQVAVAVDQTHHVLGGLAREIAGASLAVMLAAAGAGRLLAGRITRRLERLARAAEEVSENGHAEGWGSGFDKAPAAGTGTRTGTGTGTRTGVGTGTGTGTGVGPGTGARDEVRRLTASFGRMLDRLAAARQAQERLVQDAAHELRTPLTSLLANAGVLRHLGELSPDARDRLLADVEGETRELGHLVDELVELALAQGRDEPEEPVGLAETARRAARRVHRRTGRLVRLDADDSVVRGRRHALERAVGNLLENAAKFDPGDEPVEVRIRRGDVAVSDRGPGIADVDAERVFDRFYRSDAARALPGSGLGLAIVRDVAETHGGVAFAGPRPGGGATVGFTVSATRLLSPAPDAGPEARARPSR